MAYSARAMTKHFIGQTGRVALLACVAAGLLVFASLSTRVERRPTSTQIEWRSIGQWGFRWKRLVYCSEQTAAFRGWRANLGPLVVTRLRPVFAIPPVVPPNSALRESQPAWTETNQTSTAGSRR